MNPCDNCLEYEVPECAETLMFDFAFTEAQDVIVVFENHHGTKTKFDVTAGYSGGLWIQTADFPTGYFFRDNTIEVKFYESQTDYQCDNPVTLCTDDRVCLTLRIKDIDTDNLDVLIECC